MWWWGGGVELQAVETFGLQFICSATLPIQDKLTGSAESLCPINLPNSFLHALGLNPIRSVYPLVCKVYFC